MPLSNLIALMKSLSSRTRKGAIFILSFWLLIALLAPWIATTEPWYVKVGDKSYYPAFSLQRYYSLPNAANKMQLQDKTVYDWQKLTTSQIIFAPIPYAPNTSDLDNADYVSPFAYQVKSNNGNEVPIPLRFRHWLGTNKRGEDVLSGLLHGARFSLLIALSAMIISLLIGVVLGVLAGFYANTEWRSNCLVFAIKLTIVALLFFVFFLQRFAFWRIGLEQKSFAAEILLSVGGFTALCWISFKAVHLLERKNWLKAKIISIGWDTFVQRLVELIQALPLILFLLMLSAITRPSSWQLILVMGFVNWVSIARIVRVELQTMRNSDYFILLRGLGVKDSRIILHRALPAILPLIGINFSVGIAHCILAEAGLSFLGIGIPADVVSWGTLLSGAKENWNAWWLVLFPGLALASLLLSLNGIFKKNL